MKTVYIGHPLFGDGTPEWGDQSKNIERYIRFCALASNMGYTVISWIHHHMMFYRGYTPDDADYYMERDKVLLKPADLFWQAGPASVSKGLQQEIDWCGEFDIPIVHKPEWDDPEFQPDVHP